MNYSNKCDHCGHIETAYVHSLNVGKVQALKKLVESYERPLTLGLPCELGSLGISNSQYTNFCHLVYFGLAEHLENGWIPTEVGIKFIHGEVGVTIPQAVMGGVILPDDHEAWQTHTGARRTAFVFDVDETAYKKRSEYAQEKAQGII